MARLFATETGVRFLLRVVVAFGIVFVHNWQTFFANETLSIRF
jgi:hypothetical protein